MERRTGVSAQGVDASAVYADSLIQAPTQRGENTVSRLSTASSRSRLVATAARKSPKLTATEQGRASHQLGRRAILRPAIGSLRLGGVDGQAAGRGEPRHLRAAVFQPPRGSM